MRILSQSASVFGDVSTVPVLVYSIFTESKILSEAGSIMSRISSLTDTTGCRSPHSRGMPGRVGAGGSGRDAVVDERGDEHAAAIPRDATMQAANPVRAGAIGGA